MVFFRKAKKSKDVGRIGSAAGESIKNQAKWDELERLVNSDSDPSDALGATTNFAQDDLEENVERSQQSLSIQTEDLREVQPASIASDLKVNLSLIHI